MKLSRLGHNHEAQFSRGTERRRNKEQRHSCTNRHKQEQSAETTTEAWTSFTPVKQVIFMMLHVLLKILVYALCRTKYK